MVKLFLAPIRLGMNIFHRSTFVRYVFSGGTAAAIDVALFSLLAKHFHVYYLAASTFAMTVSFIARFLLQKYVTFEDKDETQSKKQFIAYSVLYLASLSATNVLLSVFIGRLHMDLILSQILSILLVAAGCFFVYKIIIFKKP